MVEKLVIELTSDDLQRLKEAATERGYSDPGHYLMALFAEDEPTSEQLKAELRESLQQVMAGDVLPLDDLWEFLDEADTNDGA